MQFLTIKVNYKPIQPMQSWAADGCSGETTGGGQSICQGRTGMDWRRWALMN